MIRLVIEKFHRFGLRKVQALRYRALARPSRTLYVPRTSIRWNINDRTITRKYYPGVVLRSFGVELQRLTGRNLKRQSIRERFLEGKPWQETPLFTKTYADRFAAGETIRGCGSLRELIHWYETNIDSLFESLKTEGLKPPVWNSGIIYAYIGPRGNVVYGRNGHHRLWMAECLSIESIPLRIFARHREWQTVRESVARHGEGYLESRGLTECLSHPDLCDLIGSTTGQQPRHQSAGARVAHTPVNPEVR